MEHTKPRPQNYRYLSDAQIELGALSPLWHPGTEEGVTAEEQGPGIPKQMLSRSFPRTQGTGEEATTG